MPGQTAHGFPYALPEDKRINWPATSRQLAEKMEEALPGNIRSGTVVGPEGRVVFPTPFTSPPIVVACAADSNGRFVVGVMNITAQGFDTLQTNLAGGQPVAARVNWIAIGI